MFDLVHDSQIVHRALVLAFSFPGTSVPVAVSSIPIGLGLEPVAAAVALTLLDPETSFWGPESSALVDLTGARRRASSEAAFLFVASPEAESWAEAFRQAPRGTLADPHGGATVVAFASVAGPTLSWLASGPGLENPIELLLPSGSWVTERNEACREFPLGVDLVWARDDGTVVALPRTTRLTAVDRKGA